MNAVSIHQFLEQYFQSNGCEIIDNNQQYLTVQLTIDMDKRLMNRPFYWHYLEKTGGVPNPMTVTFVTDINQTPDDIKGERIHFGSPRLHQIFNSLSDLGSYVRMYEKIYTEINTALVPWLSLNFLISYECDVKRDVILSLGLNLMNGEVMDHFHDQVVKKDWSRKIPDYCYTLSPFIKPSSGVIRLEKIVQNAIENDDHTWASEAKKRWDKDVELLEYFYENSEEKPPTYYLEKEAMKEQYEPIIQVKIINGGLFYFKK